ncbi:oxaloacetate tautomerase fahd2, mitochondrial-like [Haliotis cracherodii]|uniref:oxaloacetate tautomerase fahd2, mitochondrial-like n=1 Tax=Haliotis cracherodii TaxID=6455 RepID=UPI0039EBBED2
MWSARVYFDRLSSVCHRFVRNITTETRKRMRFVQFEVNGAQKVGVELSDGGDIVDLNGADKEIPDNLRSFIAGGQAQLLRAKSAVESGHHVIKRDDVRLLAPITAPEKVICIGMNYTDHCEEQNAPVPVEPVIFSKFASAIVGPYDDLQYCDETQQLDWEVEMTVVIGKTGRHIKREDAMSHVFGFTVAHDVSARDWQMKKNGGQWLLGKTMDCFCPLGPAVVMKEDIKDPHKLRLWCKVNGVTKQDSSTSNLVHKTEELLVFLSRFITLRPGDIILTGTPPGVGVFRKPPEFLKRGDIVECGIEDIGKTINKVV